MKRELITVMVGAALLIPADAEAQRANRDRGDRAARASQPAPITVNGRVARNRANVAERGARARGPKAERPRGARGRGSEARGGKGDRVKAARGHDGGGVRAARGRGERVEASRGHTGRVATVRPGRVAAVHNGRGTAVHRGRVAASRGHGGRVVYAPDRHVRVKARHYGRRYDRIVYRSYRPYRIYRGSRILIRADWGPIRIRYDYDYGRRYDGYLYAGELQHLLGHNTVTRIRRAGHRAGLRGALRGHWVDGGSDGHILVVTMEGVDVAEFIDYDRDRLIDDAFIYDDYEDRR